MAYSRNRRDPTKYRGQPWEMCDKVMGQPFDFWCEASLRLEPVAALVLSVSVRQRTGNLGLTSS